jgi:hypothetical protein
MELVLSVDGEVGVRFKFGNDLPILIPQHSFRMVRLQARPGEAVQRHSMTAKGMTQAVVRPLNSRLLNGVRHGNLDLGTRHDGTFRLCWRREPCCEVLRNLDQLPALVLALDRRQVDQSSVEFDFRPI